jgi:hypothetical protein
MDQRVRRLLAAWQSSQSPEDEAAYLTARIQEGSLGKEALRVAVWVGDEVAREVGRELLGDSAVAVKPPKSGVARFLSALPGGRPVWLRAADAGLAHRLGELAEPTSLALRCFQIGSGYYHQPSPARRAALAEAIEEFSRRPRFGGVAAAKLNDVEVACHFFLESLLHDGNETGEDEHAEWEEYDEETLGDALHFLGEACNEAEGQRLREAVTAALYPWILLGELRVEGQEGPEATLFGRELMTSEIASEILALAPPGKPKIAVAREIVLAYLKGIGWKKVRTAYRHPDGDLQVKVQKRVLRVEVGEPGAWRKHPAYAGMQVFQTDIAQELIEAARLV